MQGSQLTNVLNATKTVDRRRYRQTNELSSDRLQYKKKVYPVHYGYIVLTFEKNMNMQVIERKCIVHKLTLTETDTAMCTNAPGSCAHTRLFINTKIVSYRYTHCVSLPLPSFIHLVIPHLQHTRRLFTLQTVAVNEKPLNVGHFS